MTAVRLLRQLLDVGQAELAREAHLSVRQLVRIEKGEQLPKPSTVGAFDLAFTRILGKRERQAARG